MLNKILIDLVRIEVIILELEDYNELDHDDLLEILLGNRIGLKWFWVELLVLGVVFDEVGDVVERWSMGGKRGKR